MRILVHGGWYGSGNIGDDAILIGLRNVLSLVSPDLEVVALSSVPSHTESVCGVKAIRLSSPLGFMKNQGRYIKAFSDTDAVIISGGTPIYDYDHTSRAIHVLIPKILKRNQYCFGIGVKSLSSYHGKLILRSLLGAAKRISARDRLSQRLLNSLPLDGVKLTGDSAFFLEPDESGSLDRVMMNCGLDIDAPKVAFCPRVLSEKYKVHYHDKQSVTGIQDIYYRLAYVADHLISMGYQVLFVPFNREGFDSDLPAISTIMGSMKNIGATSISPKIGPGGLLRLFMDMEFVVGLRLHSLIFAAMSGIPFLTINYDMKIEGFIDLLDLEDLYSPLLMSGDVDDNIEDMLNKRSSIRRSLILYHKEIKQRIYAEAVEVAESITSQ
ncbi:MAG: polysaccharide pyruvyl transferase family protein [Candidatus Bathyarchaeia archaeon]